MTDFSTTTETIQDTKMYKFRTAPSASSSDRVVSFVNGGDLDWKENVYSLATILVNMGKNLPTAPYFAMVGGKLF